MFKIIDEDTDFSVLMNKTITGIYIDDRKETLGFICGDGAQYLMCHRQDCCESVSIEDITGDIEDLLNVPILMAEKATNSDDPKKGEFDESHTWTFYKLATVRGYVTIKWYGGSNGEYSEEVNFYEVRGIKEGEIPNYGLKTQLHPFNKEKDSGYD